VDDENDAKSVPTKNGETRVECGDIIDPGAGEGEGNSSPTDKEERRESLVVEEQRLSDVACLA